ncbi:MAG: ABC transporter ATP-binding protein [archaeon]|nr:ABC transporter ATP-binding protein [archaeon]
MTMEHVSVKGLSVKYGKPILKNIFLKARKGEFVSIVGKSGEGKTTLLNALAGLVDFDGEIRKPKRTAFVFQNNALFPWMNAQENIAFGMGKYSEAEAIEIMQKIGLSGKETSYPHQLSGGQQQRIAIGRAMASKPNLLLLDEPFAGLDSYTRLEMQEWINTIMQKNNITTLLVTHDIDEAILLSERVLLMKNKRIENEFNVPFTRPRNPEIRYTQQFQQLKKEIHASY